MFQPLSNLPIRTKIFVSSILTLFMICTFIFIYYPNQQKQQMFQTMEEKHHAVVDMLAFGVGFGMASGDFEAVTQALDWAKQDKSLTFLVVMDENDEVFASYNPAKISLDVPS